jgi:polysaccharide pyruvyl transferase WcaK-like protein
MVSNKMKTYQTIGLLDHMGWGNLGDAAVQESIISNIKRRLPDAQLIAFSLNPQDTQRRHGVVSYPITWDYPGRDTSVASPSAALGVRGNLKALVKRWRHVYAVTKPIHDFVRELVHLIASYQLVKSLDLLIISGGGQLSELWRGPWSHPYNVFKFCALAKLSATPVFIVGVGAGPLKHPLSKFFAGCSVRLADYTSFRDVESQALIHELGVNASTHVYPDPAYALDLQAWTTAKVDKKLRSRVGLNPIGFCDSRIWPLKDDATYHGYLDKLAVFSAWLLTQGYDLEIFTGEISVDRYAIDDLRQRLPAGVFRNESTRVTCSPRFGLKELISQMSKFDFVITSKFHGVIFSHLLGKPIVALSYHRKIGDLMRTVGHEQYCLDINSFKVDVLIETFGLLVDNSEAFRSRCHQIAMMRRSAVQEQFDGLFVSPSGRCEPGMTASTGFRRLARGFGGQGRAILRTRPTDHENSSTTAG